MPRISAEILSCAFFLYPTKEDAQRGKKPGGTGFIVVTSSAAGPLAYGVTNYHVAKSAGCSVASINTFDGEPEVFEFDPSDWESLVDGDDVAAVQLPIRRDLHEVMAISTRMFATERIVEDDRISLGDDVFMLGLFLDHHTGSVNRPLVRFGNISAMPSPVKQPNDHVGECYCIDMHSRSGFSGSPVFVYRTFGGDLTGDGPNGSERLQVKGSAERLTVEYRPTFHLLGIHCGQFSERWELHSSGKDKRKSRRFVKGVSGMTSVIPAWRILELLDIPKFVALRKEEEKRRRLELQREFPQTPMPERSVNVSWDTTRGFARGIPRSQLNRLYRRPRSGK